MTMPIRPDAYGVHPPGNPVVPLFVDEDTGNTWVARLDLQKIGYDYITPKFTGPVYLNDQWWEVAGYAESVYAYWVVPIQTEGVFDTLPITSEDDER